MINVDHSDLYQWKIKQDETTVQICFDLSDDIDPSIFHVECSTEDLGFIISIPGEIPLVCGSLYFPITTFEAKEEGHTYYVNLIKAENNHWPLLIRDRHPISKNIDPKSALDLFQMYSESNDALLNNQANEFLDTSIRCGYAPALRGYYEFAMSTQNQEMQEKAIEFLYIAARIYKDPFSLMYFGSRLLAEPDTRDIAYDCFAESASKGCIVAYSMMGQLISPLSQYSFHTKNGEKSAKLFEIVINYISGDPISYYELAKLKYVGCGIEKDQQGALKLYEKAKELDPTLPPLDSIDYEQLVRTCKSDSGDNQEKPKRSIFYDLCILGVGIAGVSAVFYMMFHAFRMKH